MIGAKRLFTVSSISLLVFASALMLLLNWSALGYHSLSVPTGSMRPSISPGSLVLVHRAPASSLKVGDVITYINPVHTQQTITHRIVRAYMIDGKVPGFVTKGDANPVPDIPIAAGSVIGRVIWHVPYLGAWTQWSKSWSGIALLVYIPALLITIEEVQRLNTYFKLAQPYRLLGFRGRHMLSKKSSHKLAIGGSLGAMFVIIGAFVLPTASALLKSSPVALTNNRLSVGAMTSGQCSGRTTNNNNVTVNSTSTQSASTGNSSNTGNTTGGSATSGNASNNNSNNVTITSTNNC